MTRRACRICASELYDDEPGTSCQDCSPLLRLGSRHPGPKHPEIDERLRRFEARAQNEMPLWGDA